jgi:hypothetical protein
MNASLVVLSCDEYSKYWDYFFALKEKYWKDCPYPTYLVTESKTCPHCETINIDSPIWTKRFREALNQLDTTHDLVMLEDYFIRKPVNQKRIDKCFDYMSYEEYDPIVWNFEKNYRDAYVQYCPRGWVRQKNRQVYLNSTQPSIWHRERLISRLIHDQTPWEWELTSVNSDYDHYINIGSTIIDNGYIHGQPFGIVQGKMTDECNQFLRKEGLI